MNTGLLLFLFILALALGWFLGFHSKQTRSRQEAALPRGEGVKHRLQLFLDSYTDDALDQFLHSLEVSPETLGLHISIGKHFRTQGEVEKAILVHQNLMSHPELSDQVSEPVVYELAKDYLVAGLYDRAEALLKQLLDSKAFRLKSRKLLLDIYERERDWDDAVSVGLTIDLKKNPEFKTRLAHYCCEIAEDERRNRALVDARRSLAKALSFDKTCVRAYLELAKLERDQGNYRASIKQLRELVALSPADTSLALPLLFECSEASDSFENYQSYLEHVYHQTGQVNVMLAIVEALLAQDKHDEAYQFLEAEALKSPSVSALDALLKHRAELEQGMSEQTLTVMTEVIAKVRSDKAAYQCIQCGFSGQHLHWMCPSCKSWQTIKPLIEYETSV